VLLLLPASPAACLQVEFPETLAPEQVSALSQVLPGPEAANGTSAMDEDTEECHMTAVADFEEEMKHRHRLSRQHSSSSNAYDSDEEDDMHGRGGQRVQCAQQ
jgi:DnaJ family protein A protein 2